MKLLIDFLKKNHFKSEPVELNQYNSIGNTPLMVATQQNDLNVLIEILNHDTDGACVNAIRKQDGITAFMLAVENNYLALVQEFLEFPKLNINQQNQVGKTALYIAAEHGFRAIVLEILECQLPVSDQATYENKTAEDIAIENGFSDIAEAIQKKINATQPNPIGQIVLKQDYSSVILFRYIQVFNKKNKQHASAVIWEQLKEEGIKLMKNINHILYNDLINSINVKDEFFKEHQAQLQTWLFSLESAFVQKRNEDARSDKSFIFDFKLSSKKNIAILLKKCQYLWEGIVDANKNNFTFLGSKPLYSDLSHQELEGTIHSTISKLVTLQIIINIYFKISIFPNINIATSTSLNENLKFCERYFMVAQDNIERIFDLNILYQIQLKQKISFIEEIERTLTLARGDNNARETLLLEIKREKESLRQKNRHHEMFAICKIMWVGLFLKQQHLLSLKIKEKIKRRQNEYISQLLDLSLEDLLQVNSNKIIIDFDQDLISMCNQKARAASAELLENLLSSQQESLERHMNFFKRQVKFYKEFITEFGISQIPFLIEENFEKCPFYLSLEVFLPVTDFDFFALYYITSFEQEKNQAVINDYRQKIENLTEEIDCLQNMILEDENVLREYNQMFDNLKNEEQNIIKRKKEFGVLLNKALFDNGLPTIKKATERDFLYLYQKSEEVMSNKSRGKTLQKLESDYFDNKMHREYTEKDIQETLKSINNNKTELFKIMETKKEMEQILETYHKKYFNLYQINQKLKLIAEVTGDLKLFQNENQYEAGNELKKKVQVKIDTICHQVLEYLTNSFEDLKNVNLEAQQNYFEKTIDYLENFKNDAIRLLTDFLLKKKCCRQYIGARVMDVGMFFEALETPFRLAFSSEKRKKEKLL